MRRKVHDAATSLPRIECWTANVIIVRFRMRNPERSRVRAVLDALQELETQFRKHITQYRPNRLEPKQGLGQTKQGRIR